MKLGGLSWTWLWLGWLVGPSRPTFVALWSAGVPAGSFSFPNQQVENQFKLPRGVRKGEWPIMWALRSETFGGKQGLTSRLSVWLQTQITSGYTTMSHGHQIKEPALNWIQLRWTPGFDTLTPFMGQLQVGLPSAKLLTRRGSLTTLQQ